MSDSWMEVVVVVIEGAGKSRAIDLPNMPGKMWTREMVWSDNQSLIVDHLKKAQSIWNCRMIHGRRVDSEWRDFIIIKSGTKIASILSGILPQPAFLDVAIEGINAIWKYAKRQMLPSDGSRRPVMLIYTDAGNSYYDVEGERRLYPRANAWGVEWSRKTKNKGRLPTDMGFIFSEALLPTSAHELGHIVADLKDLQGDPANIMSVDPIRGTLDPRRKANEDQKRAFEGNHLYVRTEKAPSQEFRSGLKAAATPVSLDSLITK